MNSQLVALEGMIEQAQRLFSDFEMVEEHGMTNHQKNASRTVRNNIHILLRSLKSLKKQLGGGEPYVDLFRN
jgi:hypothetical protein